MTILYFATPDRSYTIDLINTYSREVTKRVLPLFDQIEGEAAAAAYDQITFERAYEDLTFVRDQVTGLAISGIYHLWERLLKEFLIKESRHDSVLKKTEILSADFLDLTKFLKKCGWSVESETFYDDLDRLRLVANVIKHGDGKSCKKLLQKAPDVFYDFEDPRINRSRDASNLLIRREDFLRFVTAVQEFYQRFPERLPS